MLACTVNVCNVCGVFVVLNRDYAILQTITRAAPTANLTSCTESRLNSRLPCVCHYDICVGWYPCGLKYCRGKDSAGRIVSYRCGIKTCSNCRRFEFRVAAKSFCVWDEAEFQPFFVDSASFHNFNDDPHNWKDGDALAPSRFVNETLLRKAEPRDFASMVDVRGSDQVVRMERKRATMHRNSGGQLAKINALDDDEDAD